MDEKIQNIILEERKKLSVTNCSEVKSFNEEEVVLVMDQSDLIIKGIGLKVEEVSKKSGNVIIIGDIIDSIVYTKSHKSRKEGAIRRMFK